MLAAAVQGIADLDPDGGWRLLAFECKFGLEGQPPLRLLSQGGEIRLHGIVDRVDVNSHRELRVIDYESGGSHLTPKDLIKGQRLQLPIYAMAASQALGLDELVEGFYWKLFQAAPSSLKLSSFDYDGGRGPQAAFSLATSYIEATVLAVRPGGVITPGPTGWLPGPVYIRGLVLGPPGEGVLMDAQLNHILNLFGLTSGQRLAVSERARNTIVTAGAGSGKTRTLVARYLGLLSEGLQPRQVVAVTFTEKTAREMRSRTRTLLHQVLHQAGSPAEQQRWVGFDAQMDSVRIGTIHKIVPLDMCHPGRIIYNYDMIGT